MSAFYNPFTRTAHTRSVLSEGVLVETSRSFYKFHKKHAYPSHDAAELAGISGSISWMEGDKLYHGTSVAPWEYKPLEQEPSFINGINWSTAYFSSREKADAWAAVCGCRHDNTEYNQDTDIYSVRFHWIDNPDAYKVKIPEMQAPGCGSDKSGGVGKLSFN